MFGGGFGFGGLGGGFGGMGYGGGFGGMGYGGYPGFGVDPAAIDQAKSQQQAHIAEVTNAMKSHIGDMQARRVEMIDRAADQQLALAQRQMKVSTGLEQRAAHLTMSARQLELHRGGGFF